MKRGSQGQTLSVWIDEDVAESLTILAMKAGITRSKPVSNILEMATNDLKALDKVGCSATDGITSGYARGVHEAVQKG